MRCRTITSARGKVSVSDTVDFKKARIDTVELMVVEPIILALGRHTPDCDRKRNILNLVCIAKIVPTELTVLRYNHRPCCISRRKCTARAADVVDVLMIKLNIWSGYPLQGRAQRKN
ncbi:hypothetical protein D3C72_1767880 [compost metagenome]